MHRPLRILLVGLTVLPPVYLFIMIQLGAITFPFWDHLALIHVIAKYHDGSLHFSDLIAPHNQTRPLTYRTIYLINAILTDWDIRSEYIYMYAAIYSLWALHLYALWRIWERKPDTSFYLTCLVATVFLFSPVGHNNHWWSMMLQLNLADLLIAAGLLNVALRPSSWPAHVLSAVFLWLASYTLTNGIFAFITMIATLQLSRPRLKELDRFVLFWIANLVCLLIVYLPGIPLEDGAARPTPLAMLWFVLVYLGNPVMSLLWFPYGNLYDLPIPTLWNGAVGTIVLAISLFTLWRAREELRTRRPEVMTLFLFSGFAVISATATAWGRAAFDQYGVSNANASRYSIFALYLTLGLVYYYARRPVRDGRLAVTGGRGALVSAAGFTLFLLLATATYVRAITVYESAHDFNELLANGYVAQGAPTDFDKYLFPDEKYLMDARAQIYRLGLGPYHARPHMAVRLGSDRFVEAVPLAGGTVVTQTFTVDRDELSNLTLQLVTWGRHPSWYTVAWALYEITDGARMPKAKGLISTRDVWDWKTVKIEPGAIANSAGKVFELEFKVDPGASTGDPVGLPLYAQKGDTAPPALIDGQSKPSGGAVGITLNYERN